jgi:hypothetical protein
VDSGHEVGVPVRGRPYEEDCRRRSACPHSCRDCSGARVGRRRPSAALGWPPSPSSTSLFSPHGRYVLRAPA